MLIGLAIIAMVGLLISVYGITVEKNVLQNEHYKAACDLSDMVSCTKSFVSPYNQLLGISNIWAALFYYCCVLGLAMLNVPYILFALSSVGVCVSVYFAYILYYKVRTVCLICTSLYCINAVLMIVSYLSLPI